MCVMLHVVCVLCSGVLLCVVRILCDSVLYVVCG